MAAATPGLHGALPATADPDDTVTAVVPDLARFPPGANFTPAARAREGAPVVFGGNAVIRGWHTRSWSRSSKRSGERGGVGSP